MNKYYTYIYFDPRFDKDEAIYVGKGAKDRYAAHLRKCDNAMLSAKIKKIKNAGLEPSIILIDVETENQAFMLETFWIGVFGRHDKGTGSLCNHTDGGEGRQGGTGSQGYKWTEENKRNGSIAQKASNKRPEIQKKRSEASKVTSSRPEVLSQRSASQQATYAARRRLKHPDWTEEQHVKYEAHLAQRRAKHKGGDLC